MHPGTAPTVAARRRPRYNENLGTSAVAEKARGRAILRGYADGTQPNASTDTGQAIPVGRAVAACEVCTVEEPAPPICALPTLTPGYYRYVFGGGPNPPNQPFVPTTNGALAFGFLPDNPIPYGLSLTASGPELPVSSPIPFVPFGLYNQYNTMWFFRFSIPWSQPTATINLKLYLDDGYALRYRDRSVCGPWMPAGESWINAPGPGEGGPFRYSLPLTLTQGTLYDFELVCANFEINMVCAAWYVFNPGAVPNFDNMANPTLDLAVENSLLGMIYWYPY